MWRSVVFNDQNPFSGAIDLVGIDENMDSVYYFQVLQNCLVEKNGINIGEDRILQQDNAVNSSIYTKE